MLSIDRSRRCAVLHGEIRGNEPAAFFKLADARRPGDRRRRFGLAERYL
jgi:hypothetical protein